MNLDTLAEMLNSDDWDDINLALEIILKEKQELEEKNLWKIIEKAEWKKDHSYDRIAKLWSKLPKSAFEQLEKFIRNKQNSLYKKYEDAWLSDPGIDIGDDSWGDLLAEVVGRGEKFYNKITIKKLQKMADEEDFEECFIYCLQIED